jgi:hypothetical protein
MSIGQICREQAAKSFEHIEHRFTKRMLKKALPMLEDAIERLCPVAMQVGERGIMAIQGPYIGKLPSLEEFIFVFASADGGMCVLSRWPFEVAIAEGKAEMAKVSNPRNVVWKVLHSAIKNKDGNSAVIAAALLTTDSQRAMMLDMMNTVRRNNLLPCICILAAANKSIAGGVATILALPPTIDLMLVDGANA